MDIDSKITELENEIAALMKQNAQLLWIYGEHCHAYYRQERDAWSVRMNRDPYELSHVRQVKTREEATDLVGLVDKVVGIVLECK